MSSYEPIGPWANDEPPALSAANLNHIEAGIAAAGSGGGGSSVAVFNVSGFNVSSTAIGEIDLDSGGPGEGGVYGLYQATGNVVSAPPGDGWTLLGYGLTPPYEWQPDTAYVATTDAVFTLNAGSAIFYLWLCLTDNTNSEPPSADWRLVGQSSTPFAATSISGVGVSGTPSSGQALIADDSTDASWQPIPGVIIHPGAINNTTTNGPPDNSLSSITSGESNVAVGSQSQQNTTSGYYNTSIGVESMEANQDGTANTGIGAQALLSAVSAGNETAVGRGSLSNLVSGDSNTACGVGSGGSLVTGDSNTCIGSNSGGRDTNNSEDFSSLSSMTHSICIGADSVAQFSQVCVIGGGNPSYDASRVSLCLGNHGDTGGGLGLVSLTDAVTVPTGSPLVSGGFLFSEGGALKWMGASGTITTIAPA